MKALCAVLLCLLCGCSSLRESAHGATALDAVTTAAGVASGTAIEANPLIGSPAAFAEICARERQANPRLKCIYTTPA